jgi:1-acyl-sn-glycerol-3-phosphate acyltransferase
MKNLLNAYIRFLIKICLHGYFKKIKVEGYENIPRNVPVILVANHQNALIDPFLLATHSALKPYYLTRASVFKSPIAARLLDLIQMLPIYRMRDGFSTIHQNQQTFDQTYEVLRKNGTVLVFAEGNHSLIRNLRPLSKGFTRIAFGLKEKYPGQNPVILPAALDYSVHRKSGGRVRIIYGKPIPVDMPDSKSGLLTKSVEKALQSLVVNIPAANYDDDLNRLIENKVDLTSKADVELFLQSGSVPNPISTGSGFKNKLMKIFHFPLYFLWLWKSSSVKDKVFDSTWKFLICFVFGPIWYLLLLWMAIDTSIGSWALAFLIMAWISLQMNKNPQE